MQRKRKSTKVGATPHQIGMAVEKLLRSAQKSVKSTGGARKKAKRTTMKRRRDAYGHYI